MRTMTIARTAIALFLTVSLAPAASPPQVLNYQGILRDINGNPLSGTYDMVFRLEDSGTGTEILIDEHLGGAAGSGVTVANGLFTVQIGSGIIMDGGGPGNYTMLADVFRDHDDVLLRIEVNGEVLSPAIPIASTPYALNATHFDGLVTDQFIRKDLDDAAFGKIWFSGTPIGSSVGSGPVFVSPATANVDDTLLGLAVSFQERFRVDAEGDTFIGGLLHMPNGAQFWDNGFGLQIYGGDADTDDVFIRAGNSSDDGALTIVGGGQMELRSATGEFHFRDGTGTGGHITTTTLGSYIYSGDQETDDLVFYAGDGPGHGSLVLAGDSLARLTTGNGTIELESDGLLGSVWLTGPSDSFLYVESDRSLEMVTDSDGNNPNRFAWYTGAPPRTQLAELQPDGDFQIAGLFESSVGFDVAESFLMVEFAEPGDLVSVDDSRGDAVRLSAGIDDAAVIGVVSTLPGLLLGGAPFEPQSLRAVWGEELHEEFMNRREELERMVLQTSPGLRRGLEKAANGMHSSGTQTAEHRERAAEEKTHLESQIRDRALEIFCKERLAAVALAGRVPVKVDAGYGSIQVGDLLTSSPTPGHAMRADDPRPGTVIGKALESLDSGTGKVLALVMLR